MLNPYLRLSSLLEMLELYAHSFYRLSELLTKLTRDLRDFPPDTHAPEDFRETIKDSLGILARDLTESRGFPVSVKTIYELMGALTTNAPVGRLRELAAILQDVIGKEAASIRLLQIPPEKVSYFDSKHLFGEMVSLRFASATTDIEEAGRCFALGRNTACVFHVMRAVEVGLRSVARNLQIPRLSNSWEVLLRDIKDAIQAHRNKRPRPKHWTARDPFLIEAHALLHAYRLAWRNPTMHVIRIYIEEEAQDVFQAGKSFMRHLAAKLDETGKWVGGR